MKEIPQHVSESTKHRNPTLYPSVHKIPDTKQRERPEELARSSPGKAPGSGCPVVRFILLRTRLLDVDAKYGSVKDLLDGLQHAGLIHGDKEGQIHLKVDQIRVPHFKDELTIIEIDYDNE
jgi:hypothetical protein